MKSKTMPYTLPIKEVYKSIVEGRAVLHVASEKVFYNPVQEFNRDLSIVALSVFVEDYKRQKLLEAKKLRERDGDDMEEDNAVNITILEALSATGLRSIRYAKEIVDVTKIIANDISEQAVNTIKHNVAFNNVDHIIETSHEDACLLMHKHKQKIKRFTAIDLDPYGSPSIFLDSAVQSVADGGLLLVTATDMAVLAGNSPETCYSKYGAISLKTRCCHEMALRILLQCIESHANRYSRYIEPMLSVSADFYIRVIVKVHSGAGHCKMSMSKLSMVYNCVGCDSMTLQPLGAFKPNPTPSKPDQVKGYLPSVPPVGARCENCNQKHQMGGPIWSGPLHDKSFVARALDFVRTTPSQLGTTRRLLGVLSVLLEELDAPLYYTLDRLCGTLHSEMLPIMQFRSAVLNAGYQVSYSHAHKLSLKTDAPNKLVWDIMRTWVTFQPVKAAKLEANPVARYILSQPCTYKVALAERDDANPASRRERQTRFQFNPTPYWGPGCRSKVNTEINKNMKAIQNQNKKKGKNKGHHKRQLSPTDQKQRNNKKMNKHITDPARQLVINTATSEGDSDGEIETIIYLDTVGTTDNVQNGENHVDNADTDGKDDKAPQPNAEVTIPADPTDKKE